MPDKTVLDTSSGAFKSEKHYGLFCITDAGKDKKPGKRPAAIKSPVWPKAPDKAFVYDLKTVMDTLTDLNKNLKSVNASLAKSKVKDKSKILGYQLGYLARPDSLMVMIDIDACRDKKSGELEDWAQEIIGDYSGPILPTVSGTGLRIPQPRAPGDEKTNGGEAHGVGFMADGKKGVTLPVGSMKGIYRDQGMIDRLLERRGKPKDNTSSRSGGASFLDYPILTFDEIAECVKATKNDDRFADRDSTWIAMAMGLKRRFMGTEHEEDAWALFDDWTHTGDYDHNDADNRRAWDSISAEGDVTIASWYHHARHDGWKMPEKYRESFPHYFPVAQTMGDDDEIDFGYELERHPTVEAEMMERFVYSAADGLVYDRLDRVLRTKGNTVDITMGVDMFYINAKGKKNPVGASVGARSFWFNSKCQVINGTVWAPGKPDLITDMRMEGGYWHSAPGDVWANMWKEPRKGVAGDVSLWVDHIKSLYPVEVDTIIKWAAWQIQRPGQKVNWALVLGSSIQGVGKDAIFDPLAWALGDAYNGGLRYSMLISGYDDGILNRTLAILQEAARGTKAEAMATADTLKTYITAPPRAFTLNPKGKGQVQVENLINIAIMTNHADALYVAPSDRRYGIAWTDAPKQSKEYYDRLFDWLGTGGNEAVVEYLSHVGLSDMPRDAPDWSGKGMMADAGKSEVQVAIEALLDRGLPVIEADGVVPMPESLDSHGEFEQCPAVSITWLKDALNAMPGHEKITGQKITSILRDDMGYVRIGNPGWRCYGTGRSKHVIYANDMGQMHDDDVVHAAFGFISKPE